MRKKQLKCRLRCFQDELDETKSLALSLMDTVKPDYGWYGRFMLELGITAADEDAVMDFRKWLSTQNHVTLTGEAMIEAFDTRMRNPFKGKLEALLEAEIKDGRGRDTFLRLIRLAREKAS